MATVLPMPGAMTPVARILSTFNRDQIASFIEVAIGLLDVADGDPDVELNGDEADGVNSEDDFWPHDNDPILRGPGCPVSDPSDEDQDSEPMLGMPEAGAGYWGAGGFGSPHAEDDEAEDDGRAGRLPHTKRIRETRCDRLPYDRFRLREKV